MKLKRRLVQVKSNQKANFRERWHYKQDCICPLLKRKIPFGDVALDHKHKRKNDPVGPDGAGLIRGVVQMQANAFEGKVANSFKRLGLSKYIDLPDLLRNLADYLEHPTIPQRYIHPDEEKKKPVLSKQSWNQLVRLYTEKYPNRKPLRYVYRLRAGKKPKPAQKLTKTLAALYREFNIKPKYLKE